MIVRQKKKELNESSHVNMISRVHNERCENKPLKVTTQYYFTLLNMTIHVSSRIGYTQLTEERKIGKNKAIKVKSHIHILQFGTINYL